MTRTPHGPDHDLHPYSPLPTRPAITLPGGASVAVVLLLQVEARELTPPKDAWRDPRFRNEFGSYEPDWRSWTTREYGNRVGVYRLLEAIDRHGFNATVPTNLLAARRHPEIVDEIRQRGWEFAGHGLSETRMITSRMSEAEERAHIAEALGGLRDATGATIAGWLGQDAGGSERTPRLLAEASLHYTLDWANDEEPYLHTVPGGLVSIPHPMDLDDAQLLFLRKVPPQRFPALVAEALDVLVSEGRAGRVLSIGLRPWLSGQPHRIRYVRELLEAIAARRGPVLVTTAGAIAAHVRAAAG